MCLTRLGTCGLTALAIGLWCPAPAGAQTYEITNVIVAATRNATEWLGRADAGTVTAGKRADPVLLDADRLADIANAARIRGVMLNGKWYDRTALDRMLEEVAVEVRSEE